MEEQKACLTYLRRERRRWALTQKELAAIVGCSEHHFSLMERGKYPPARNLAVACCVLFGLAPDEMFPDHYAEIEETLMRSVYELVETLEGITGPDADKKRAFADQVLDRAVSRMNASAL